jgi:uncharacterized membrane protein YdjX (TVP38/TMEM64 family)
MFTPTEPDSRRRIVLVAAVVLGGVALLFGGPRVAAQLPELTRMIASAGFWGPVLFVTAYAVATVCLIPGSLLTLAAGALFGLVQGATVVFLGAMLGSSLAFLASRYVARTSVEARLARHPRFAAVDRAIAQDGRRIVFLLRLSPIFPFALLNYALGLTRVRFIDYVAAGVGMLPGTILYVYYGKLVGDVASLASGAVVSRGAAYWGVLLLGLTATVLATALVTRRARAALQAATDERAA